MKSIAEPGDTLLLVPPFCVNSPFNMRTLLPEKKSRPEVVPQIWEYSRKHYARPLAEVEAEIQEAWIGKKEEGKPPKEFPHLDLGEDEERDEEEGKKAGEKEEKPEVRDPAN